MEIAYGRRSTFSITDDAARAAPGVAEVARAAPEAERAEAESGGETGEEPLYFSRQDPLNDCTYPRRRAGDKARGERVFGGRRQR
ncbi:MAG: hypothetical protein R3B70_21285 [Polyangiaceae bacterium]